MTTEDEILTEALRMDAIAFMVDHSELRCGIENCYDRAAGEIAIHRARTSQNHYNLCFGHYVDLKDALKKNRG